MTGLDLETFLHLLRADLGAWATLGVAGVGLALLVWSSWRSRRVLRRCLVLSLAAHLGLVMYGSTVPAVRKAVRGGTADPTDREHIRQIRVAPLVESGDDDGAGRPGGGGEGLVGGATPGACGLRSRLWPIPSSGSLVRRSPMARQWRRHRGRCPVRRSPWPR